MLQKSEYFRPIDKSEQNSEFIAMESRSFWRDVWERFRSNRRALVGFIILLLIALLAIIGPLVSPYPYDGMGTEINRGPSAAHWFGTDALGRDLFTRVLYGIRISLFVGFVSTLINVVIGIVYGGVAGYVGGKLDNVMMRIVDVIYAVPSLLYIILLMMLFGANVGSIMLGMCISGWVGNARLMRTQVIALKEREYVLASYTQGASPVRILLKHIFPNAMGPILVQATLAIPQAIFQEAFLSFIGMGISAPQASLGTLAQDARMYMVIYPHQMVCPIVMICVIIFALNFISEGLSEALDPTNNR
ncbi:MAG TPA: ABC transporter permease [Firmicutes bacterium]|nr:ABC transporter permease [Bacillota bacterium]